MPDIFTSPQSSQSPQNKNNAPNQHDNMPEETTPETPDTLTSSQNKNKAPNRRRNMPEETTPGIFSTCVHHPQNFTFSHQEEDEKIVLFMRRHFITNLPWIIAVFIAFIAPLFIASISQLFDSPIPLSPGPSIIIVSFYYLSVLGFALFSFADWFYNIGIASEKRLLDIDFTHLSHIDVALTLLPEVEDVVYKQKGFFASFFNYGDVVAHTVANKEDFVFEKVPMPDQVVQIISRSIADTGH